MRVSAPKRLLLLAYYYPPRPGVGSRRPAYLRKYLPQFGWEATILTARLNGYGDANAPGVVATNYVDILASVKRRLGLNGAPTHERFGLSGAPEADMRKSLRHRAISLAYQAFTFPDREVGWTPFALRALRDAVQREHFDAVMTTSPPYVAGIVAALADCGVPWVADIRDLWTGTDIIERDAPVRWMERKLERWMLRRASAITAVSKPMEEYLVREIPCVPVETIYNAFDPDDWRDVPFETNERCTFLYAGSLYRGRQQPQPIFRAVRRLLDRGALAANDVQIDIYSDESAWLTRVAQNEGVGEIVRSFDYVPQKEIMRLERRADRLVYFVFEGFGAETIVSGRMLEYLGARRRVLAVGGPPRSAVDDVLSEARAGTRCTTTEQLDAEVLRAVHEFKEHRTRMLPADAAAAFDAPHMARHAAHVLDRVVERQRSLAT